MLLTDLVTHAQPQADPIAILINLPLLALFIGLALYGFFRSTPSTSESDDMDLVATDDQSSVFAEPSYSA